MAITINGKVIVAAAPAPKKKSGHTKPRAPAISLSEPGRLRVANLLALFAISHSALYAQLNLNRFPKPDGHDPRPYWRTETIRQKLQE